MFTVGQYKSNAVWFYLCGVRLDAVIIYYNDVKVIRSHVKGQI